MTKIVFWGSESDTKNDFLSALQQVGDSARIVSFNDLNSIIRVLKDHLREKSKNVDFGTLAEKLRTNLILNSKGIYYIGSGPTGKIDWTDEFLLGHLGTYSTGKKKVKVTFNYSNKFWQRYIENKSPSVSPLINHTTLPASTPKPAKTLFNILCLDYMEDVDGNYVMSEMFTFWRSIYIVNYADNRMI